MPPTRKDVLDLPLRRRIYEAIAEHPGIHLRALAERLEMAVSSLEYHCYHLERTGHVTTRDAVGFKSFYPAQGIDRRDKDILAQVRHGPVRQICARLILEPGITPKQLKQHVGVSGPTLSFHLKKLRDLGWLQEEPDGRTKRLSLHDAERVANVLVTYRQSFMDDAVDRFAKTWLSLNR